ncbi:class II aldolase/adducin family protein [Leifsonia sp. NPDC058292]|uniref:class II aldolase/adducin family protein n=1 Tax=Leifsonia sp. NPDC058292 TaxID=3346428 RepID=UPI0036DB6790
MTPGPASAPSLTGEANLREAIVQAARHLSALGLSPGSSGNLSVRLGDSILATPTGASLRNVQPADLALVGSEPNDSAPLSAADGPRPTKELPLHRAMYDERPDAAAVIHLHSPYSTAIACLPPDRDGFAALPNLTPYRVMRLGPVPIAAYAAPGSEDLAASVRKHAAAHAVLLLANHGPVVAAPTLDAAIDLIEELETAAQLTLLLRQAPAVALTDEAVATLRPPGH